MLNHHFIAITLRSTLIRMSPRVPSMNQIDMFENYYYQIGIHEVMCADYFYYELLFEAIMISKRLVTRNHIIVCRSFILDKIRETI